MEMPSLALVSTDPARWAEAWGAGATNNSAAASSNGAPRRRRAAFMPRVMKRKDSRIFASTSPRSDQAKRRQKLRFAVLSDRRLI